MKAGSPIKVLLPVVVLCAILVVIFWPSNDEPQQVTTPIELADPSATETQTSPVNKVIRNTPPTEIQSPPTENVAAEESAPEEAPEEVKSNSETTPVVATTPEAKPLPDINDSDSAIKQEMAELPNGTKLISLMVDNELIRKGVRAIHALSEGTIVKEYRPVTSAPGTFLANEAEVKIETKKTYRIAPKNFERYNNHLKVLTAIPPSAAADLYAYYYPLLQQAYDELGLPEDDFRTITLRALDNFLQANQASPDLMTRPSVMFIYADKKAEQASGVQKLLWRMGTGNSEKLQNWISEFKQELNAQ